MIARLIAALLISLTLLLPARQARSGTTTLTTIIVGGVITTVVVVILIMHDPNEKSKSPKTAKAERLAEIYLRTNADNIKQEIAAGEGYVLNDLAASFEISPDKRKYFGSLLKKEREQLMSLADPKTLTPSRAGDFLRAVAKIAEIDTELNPEILAFKKKYKI